MQRETERNGSYVEPLTGDHGESLGDFFRRDVHRGVTFWRRLGIARNGAFDQVSPTSPLGNGFR
ncbi:MAG: hypothetical protein PHC78_13635, partial [Verrucomicrobiota bacterium]|nr:hypothetical protein [Verrucomicrobiota bacterium]